MEIDYNRVVAAFGGKLVSLTPRRARSDGEDSPGMRLKFRVDDETITLEDTVSAVIDGLCERLGND